MQQYSRAVWLGLFQQCPDQFFKPAKSSFRLEMRQVAHNLKAQSDRTAIFFVIHRLYEKRLLLRGDISI